MATGRAVDRISNAADKACRHVKSPPLYFHHPSMGTKTIWTKDALERTDWAAEFKRGAPVSFAMAFSDAQEQQLDVLIERTDETGEQRWVIRVLHDPAFWMDAKATKKAAVELCREMGWKVAA